MGLVAALADHGGHVAGPEPAHALLARQLLAGTVLDGSLVRVTLTKDGVAFESQPGGFSG